jgi:hypothetical protein
MVHFGFAVARAAWSYWANAAAGRSLAFEVVIIVALELACAALWRAAKPGHARESLPLLKAFNLAQMSVALLQFLYIFEYYVADLRKLPDMGEVAAKRLADEGVVKGGAKSVAAWTETLRGLTLFLDLTLMLFVMFGARTAHVLILDKMRAQKAREQKRAGGGGGAVESTTGMAAFARREPAAAAAAGNGGGGAAAAAAAVVAAKASDRTRARRRHA